MHIYSYIKDTDLEFYKTHRLLANKMDILDWIMGSYGEEIIEGGESPLDMARRIDPNEMTMMEVEMHKPLVAVHPSDSSQGMDDEIEEEEVEEDDARVEGDVEAGAMGYTQESEAPQRKKSMRAATLQSKLAPNLVVDDARDIYSSDATSTFRKMRTLKGNHLYSEYGMDNTIAINSIELAKRLRLDPPSPTAFAVMVKVKPEALTMEEANEM